MKINLNSGWKFAHEGNKYDAKVPGVIHADLYEHGLIEHPYYGKNEIKLQWIGKQDWEYTNVLDVSKEILENKKVELVFEGLDTYANVFINGIEALNSKNMFLEYKVDVKKYLKEGKNDLKILFDSVEKIDLPKIDKLGYNLPASNDASKLGELDDNKISVHARKAPYHYGWDWGPRLLTCGIWRNVYLNVNNDIEIDNIYIKQSNHTENSVDLEFVTEIEGFTNEYNLEVLIDGKTYEFANGGSVLNIMLENPKLWWPNGFGEQNLYDVTINLKKDNKLINTKQERIGIRTIRLVREEDDRGTSFMFEVNGKLVFAKGSNHIPNDTLTPWITKERYDMEIENCVLANYNMIRVWGGGYYEDDYFYKLCDEKGLLVWQDFMFACSMYPGDEDFISNVKDELVYNIKRIRNHASLALWCGNNEIDSAWNHFEELGGWGWKQEYNHEQREKIYGDYKKIFYNIIPEAVRTHCPHIAYWASSPWTGDENKVAGTFNKTGDVHYWGVWHGDPLQPFSTYGQVKTRFLSEYGVQSFPSVDTLLTICEEEDLSYDSEIMLHHQKTNSGNYKIKHYIGEYFDDPTDLGFRKFVYSSQIMQALAIRMAVEYHRQDKPYCMGTLYWQTNDCWPVASWSSMDYYGNWKALRYFIRESYKRHIAMYDEKDNSVYICTDSIEKSSLEINVEYRTLNNELLSKEVYNLDLEANETYKLLTVDESFDSKNSFISLTIKDNNDDKYEYRRFIYTEKAIDLNLNKDENRYELVEDGGKLFIEAKEHIMYVEVSRKNIKPLKYNYFDVPKGERVEIVSHDEEAISKSEIKIEIL